MKVTPIIRSLKVEEVGLCSRGGFDFFKEAGLPGMFKPEVFTDNWKAITSGRRGCILGMFNGEEIMGALGMVMAPELNTGEIIGVECFWFMLAEYRKGSGAIRLLSAFEELCVKLGCHRAAMIHLTGLNDVTLEKFYRRRGYKMVETHYVKSL